jgi:hypothetical protein
MRFAHSKRLHVTKALPARLTSFASLRVPSAGM